MLWRSFFFYFWFWGRFWRIVDTFGHDVEAQDAVAKFVGREEDEEEWKCEEKQRALLDDEHLGALHAAEEPSFAHRGHATVTVEICKVKLGKPE
jgi:hypothetical protein